MFALRERRVCFHVVANITPPTLHKILGQFTTVQRMVWTREVFRQIVQFRIEQRQQGTKGFFFATVRCGCDQNQMPFGIVS